MASSVLEFFGPQDERHKRCQSFSFKDQLSFGTFTKQLKLFIRDFNWKIFPRTSNRVMHHATNSTSPVPRVTLVTSIRKDKNLVNWLATQFTRRSIFQRVTKQVQEEQVTSIQLRPLSLCTLRYDPHATFARPAKKLSISEHHPAMQSSCIRPSYLSTLDYPVKVPTDFGNSLLGVLDETAAIARTVQVKHNSQRRTHGWKGLGFLAVFRKNPSKQTKQAFSSLFRIFGQTRRAEKDVIVIKRSPQQAEKISTNPPYRSRQAQERMHTPGCTKWKH